MTKTANISSRRDRSRRTRLDGGWIKPELRREEEEDLTDLLRLNVKRQAQRRGENSLYVIAWWIPTDWEPALQRDLARRCVL